METDDPVREELDEWLAQGKIDRETHDRLVADHGAAGRVQGSGLLTGAAGLCVGLGVAYLLWPQYGWEPRSVGWASLGGAVALGFVGSVIARATRMAEMGRFLAVVGSILMVQAALIWFSLSPGERTLSWMVLALAAGLFVMAYASTSALVLLQGTLWLTVWLSVLLAERAQGPVHFGCSLGAHACLGAFFLLMGRDHVVRRWPPGASSIRFAKTYQLVGLTLINGAAFLLGWAGWDGDGYPDVAARAAGVSMAIGLYVLEIWAGLHSRMHWIAALGVAHFLLQIWAILLYPHASLRARAIVVIALGLALLALYLSEGGDRDPHRRQGQAGPGRVEPS
jgi:hypothetical protein